MDTNSGFRILSEKRSNEVVNMLFQFMGIYEKYLVPNERTTLINNNRLSLMIKKAEPEYLTQQGFTIYQKVSVKFLFNITELQRRPIYKVEIVVMDVCPAFGTGIGFVYPFVKMNITNAMDGSEVNADVEIELERTHATNNCLISGALPITLFWQIEEKHIETYRYNFYIACIC